jgi:hypothetical protein
MGCGHATLAKSPRGQRRRHRIPDCSRTAAQEIPPAPETRCVSHRSQRFPRVDRHPARQQPAVPGKRSPGCSPRKGADAGIAVIQLASAKTTPQQALGISRRCAQSTLQSWSKDGAVGLGFHSVDRRRFRLTENETHPHQRYALGLRPPPLEGEGFNLVLPALLGKRGTPGSMRLEKFITLHLPFREEGHRFCPRARAAAFLPPLQGEAAVGRARSAG